MFVSLYRPLVIAAALATRLFPTEPALAHGLTSASSEAVHAIASRHAVGLGPNGHPPFGLLSELPGQMSTKSLPVFVVRHASITLPLHSWIPPSVAPSRAAGHHLVGGCDRTAPVEVYAATPRVVALRVRGKRR